MGDFSKGIYVLEIYVKNTKELTIGSLPKTEYSGHYLYVGSALGPGGYKRVSRHLEVARGVRSGGHWHVDYLLDAGKVVNIWLLPTDEKLECKLARELADTLPEPVEGFGASDCGCYSHLFELSDRNRVEVERTIIKFSPKKPVRFEPE